MIDVHPIAVHFPIALLSLYAVIQLVSPKITWKYNSLFAVHSFLLLVGSSALLVARQLGDLAQRNYPEANRLVRTHETWANNTVVVFGILTIIYIFLIIKKLEEQSRIPKNFHKYIQILKPAISLALFLFTNYIVTLLALIGLVCITITGALGGAIVYGPDADPVVQAVYSYFVR